MQEMPILFCNIAWMKHYAGRNSKDPPLGGGGFPRSEGYCGEELNFLKCNDGFVYGHFETIKGDDDRQVCIERLGAGRSDQYLDGVDIVWTAPVEGHDPRCIVGWYRNARIYRHRQLFNGQYPTARHKDDEIQSFRVKARNDDAVLLPTKERTLTLGRGPGWSGQASWWYAQDTQNADARRFVRGVQKLLNGAAAPSSTDRNGGRGGGKAGRATPDDYSRYVNAYEAVISPRHDKLQRRFEAFLSRTDPGVRFLQTFRDDLRYVDSKGLAVMAEIKPTEPATLRFAIRTAIGQLLDYKQQQQWPSRQLIVVETAVSNADDRALAFASGFGLAWPDEDRGFTIIWPK
ncbi:MAG: hypothetical protein IPP45_03995 [Sphingomonadales bacterium]|jgi:hypothetical protein|nr:hypothetical protein [Sphingomonadales bacterium]MBL0000496.1 hypothetical protein [Sphingomonadales bacterium]MBL0114658.1 hypothetical protein [Sphingomonadales bacterium]